MRTMHCDNDNHNHNHTAVKKFLSIMNTFHANFFFFKWQWIVAILHKEMTHSNQSKSISHELDFYG